MGWALEIFSFSEFSDSFVAICLCVYLLALPMTGLIILKY